MKSARGYTLVAMMVGITIMMVMIAAVLPLASTESKRDREAELVFRGRQYAEGVRVFHRRYARYPNTLKEMIDARPRTLRKLWKDPVTRSDKWGIISATLGAPIPGQTGNSGLPNSSSGLGGNTLGQTGGSTGTSSFGSTFGSASTKNQAAQPTPGPGLGVGPDGGEKKSGSSWGSTENLEQAAGGPVAGVYSLSHEKALKLYQGRDSYADWRFTEQTLTSGPDLGGIGAPGGPGIGGAAPPGSGLPGTGTGATGGFKK